MSKNEKPQTKICKHCKTEIPYGAKVCPQCRKKQGMGCLVWAIIIIVALGVIGVLAGRGDDSKEVKVKEKEKTEDTNNEDNEAVGQEGEGSKEETEGEEANVEILAEYTLADGISWYTRHFIVVKNNSEETVEISTSSLAYGEDGSMVSAADASFDALGAGCTSVFYEAFETDKKIDHYETDIKASKSKYYQSVIQDLSFVQNDIEGGAIFQVTNNGSEAAEFVQGYALFFLGEQLVGYENTYFVDDDSELKPGATASQQMTTTQDYDRIEFYLDGRR
ncbi:MAG: zinc ribbon domain-containing protein [Lachnospiraceae bacterium]|jgi:hypothetical protein|nr:zinc ribbon domain-containing protein [Lachnospiraceae bacterium]